MGRQIAVYDSTLRDGTQGEGIAFSIDDKIKIVRQLDALGVAYIEAGNPGSNPKDMEFFQRVGQLRLQNAKIAAFGSTHKVGVDAGDDPNIRSLEAAGTDVVAIFGKAWDLHVAEVLRTDEATNLALIRESVDYFVQRGRAVVFDAEHFFDGYKHNPEYAMRVLGAAAEAGAAVLTLCDTNGAAFPDEVYDITKAVCGRFPGVTVGIHCHNDTGMAVANTMQAVLAGAAQVQGTFNGFGERCGNANLCTILPNLQLKRGHRCIPEQNMHLLRQTSRFIYELANLAPDERKPYVGGMAFAHKGGMHIDAVHKNPATFEHVDPAAVGNERRFLMSEMSGRSTVISAIKKVDPSIERDSPETEHILRKLKTLESEGYQFEGAESSFELLVRKELRRYIPYFRLEQFKVFSIAPNYNEYSSSAMIKIKVDGKEEITAAEGDGPINALDGALRKALVRFYPEINDMRLIDFKVRVLDGNNGTASKVRVLIESTDGQQNWSTVGVSTDIVDASWKALVDSVEYLLHSRRGE